jgi:hypothetical protein
MPPELGEGISRNLFDLNKEPEDQPLADNLMISSCEKQTTSEQRQAEAVEILHLVAMQPPIIIKPIRNLGVSFPDVHAEGPLANNLLPNISTSTSRGKDQVSHEGQSASIRTLKQFQQGENSCSNQHTPRIIGEKQADNSVQESNQLLSLNPKETYQKHKKQKVDGKGHKKGEQSTGLTIPAESNQNVRPFNVKSWNFLREGGMVVHKDKNVEDIFVFLNECKHEKDTKKPFSLTREQALQFQVKIFSRKKEFKSNIISEIHTDSLNHQLYGTLLRISNNKIQLEQYPTFYNGIMGGIRERIKSKWVSIPNPPRSILNGKSIMGFVGDFTKIAHLQIVACMRLFNENQQEFLTTDENEKILKILNKFWIQAYEGSLPTQNKHWAAQLYSLLNLKEYNKSTFSLPYENKRIYPFCWHAAYYWAEEADGSFKYKDGRLKKFDAGQVIDHIIFFLNFNTISARFKFNQSIYKRQKRKKIEI